MSDDVLIRVLGQSPVAGAILAGLFFLWRAVKPFLAEVWADYKAMRALDREERARDGATLGRVADGLESVARALNAGSNGAQSSPLLPKIRPATGSSPALRPLSEDTP